MKWQKSATCQFSSVVENANQLRLIVSKPLMLLAYFCNIPSTAMEFQLTKFHGAFAEALTNSSDPLTWPRLVVSFRIHNFTHISILLRVFGYHTMYLLLFLFFRCRLVRNMGLPAIFDTYVYMYVCLWWATREFMMAIFRTPILKFAAGPEYSHYPNW